MAISTKKISGDESVHYVSPRKRRVKGKPKMQPPLTPMIDVTFQLLLFFLMTFTFREAEGQIPGSLPKAGGGGVTTSEQLELPIRITLRPSGAQRTQVIFEISDFNFQTSSEKELGAILQKRSTQGGTDVHVIIDCRGDVQWKWVVEAFNQSVRAKYKNIGFSAGT